LQNDKKHSSGKAVKNGNKFGASVQLARTDNLSEIVSKYKYAGEELGL